MVQVSSLPVETICSMTRNRQGASGRGVIGYMGKKLCGYLIRSLADYYHRDSVTMSQGIGKVEGRRGVDKVFQARLQRLEEAITRDWKRKIGN